MSLKKLGVALLAVFVLGATAANSAFAANEYSETGGQWYTGASPGTKVPLGTTVDIPELKGGPATLNTTAGANNVPLDLTATSVTGKECSIINPLSNEATIECEQLTYSGITVSQPASCSVAGGSVTTKRLIGVLGMNKAGTVATVKITPKEGATFATLELTGEKCSIGGLYKVTGTVFGQAKNATGVFAKTQVLSSSKEIQESAGEANSLKFGEHAATITGSLEGTRSEEWAGKEK